MSLRHVAHPATVQPRVRGKKTDIAIIGTNAILLCFQISLVYLKLRQ